MNWFPDWSGSVAAVIASGPSAKKVDISLLRGRAKVIAIKECHELAPWADAVYGCDAAFWTNCQGLPKFAGLKISYSAREPGVERIDIDVKTDRLLMNPLGTVGSGGNSGFQALNLALQFGARRIVLAGFDMTDAHGIHWFGAVRDQGRTNPAPWNFKRWTKAFSVAATQLPMMGATIINASPLTALDCFPIMPLDAALGCFT